MREITERVYFVLCTGLAGVLRAGRYSTTRVVSRNGALEVRKQRRLYAPVLLRIGNQLLGMLDTGVRVLPQREWEERERRVYRSLYGSSIGIDRRGVLVLPFHHGRTLAAVLEDSGTTEAERLQAIGLAVAALVSLHHAGFTHGDAMAENVMVELESDVARWFDFETIHETSRDISWRRADDLRALLFTCVARTHLGNLTRTVNYIVDSYADEAVIAAMASCTRTGFRRALPFHLGQARLAFEQMREIERVLSARGARSRGEPAVAAGA